MTEEASKDSPPLLRYVLCIFLGAFLLFQIQPMAARLIHPRFGGGAGIWTACMVFFQSMLVLGYAYGHLLERRLSVKAQFYCHIGVAVAALAFLPIRMMSPGTFSGLDPSVEILLVLLIALGLPFLLVASSSPLTQAWCHRTHPGRSPYWLYAISNIGSLLGLAAYPFIIEPLLTLQAQRLVWSGSFTAFVIVFLWCARTGAVEPATDETDVDSLAEDPKSKPIANPGKPWQWFSLSACGSVALLAVTNELCHNVAPVPFLWVLPLAIYLCTFIIAFRGDGNRYSRRLWTPIFAASVVLTLWLLIGAQSSRLIWQNTAYFSVALFAFCMTCHGELSISKPHAKYLTGFYLWISIGGAAGGSFVGLLAPAIFDGYWELHIAVLALFALVGYCAWNGVDAKRWPFLRWLWVAGGCAIIFASAKNIHYRSSGYRLLDRNFYGVLQVYDVKARNNRKVPYDVRWMVNGGILHGGQFTEQEHQRKVTTYFGPLSGVNMAMTRHPKRIAGEPMTVGIVGLGAGVLAALTEKGDVGRYYEINPACVKSAETDFFFLKNSLGSVEMVVGDGRLKLQEELNAGQSHQFDMLALDAFTGDAVPVHLLTHEAIALYKAHLAPDGILCINVTNTYIDLQQVVRTLAREAGMQVILVESNSDKSQGLSEASFMLMTNNKAFLEDPVVKARIHAYEEPFKAVHWTDDYSSIFPILRK